MTDRAEDSAGDYGYDMAHEQRGREKAPGERSGEHVGPSPARRKVEAEQDMSYDEAHDF